MNTDKILNAIAWCLFLCAICVAVLFYVNSR